MRFLVSASRPFRAAARTESRQTINLRLNCPKNLLPRVFFCFIISLGSEIGELESRNMHGGTDA